MSNQPQQRVQGQPCPHCIQPINPAAKVCPHCRRDVKPKRFAFLRRVLKWIGIIFAVLVFLTLLNSIFNRDSDEIIANAVRATLEAGGQIAEVTREVEVTRETIKEVEITREVEITKEVEVTREVLVTAITEVEKIAASKPIETSTPVPMTSIPNLPDVSTPTGYCDCDSGRDCRKYATHAEAQECHEYCIAIGNEKSFMDVDDDGVVCEDLVPTSTPTNLPTNTSTLTPMPTSTPVIVTVNNEANLRSGPSTDFEIVGSVPSGSTVQVVSQNLSGDWYELNRGGWIAAFLVDGDIETIPTLTSTPDITIPLKQALVNKIGISVRGISPAITFEYDDRFKIGRINWVTKDALDKDSLLFLIRHDLKDMLEILANSGLDYDFVDFVGTASLVNVYGEENEKPVVWATFLKEDVDRIQWDNFLPDNVYNIASSSKLHIMFND